MLNWIVGDSADNYTNIKILTYSTLRKKNFVKIKPLDIYVMKLFSSKETVQFQSAMQHPTDENPTCLP